MNEAADQGFIIAIGATDRENRASPLDRIDALKVSQFTRSAKREQIPADLLVRPYKIERAA
jgi:hypothetical protein